ncbi:MAG: hypothetical protein IJQ50_05685 [Clostridia bacterium]|nr:hypothetical protein [Clostridia bacterium]
MKKIISIAICILAATANNIPVNEKENEFSGPIKPEIVTEIIIAETESTAGSETHEKENSVQEKFFVPKTKATEKPTAQPIEKASKSQCKTVYIDGFGYVENKGGEAVMIEGVSDGDINKMVGIME